MKHIFLAFGLMAAIACMSKNKPKSTVREQTRPSTDTIRTTVTFATGARDFQAKVYYMPKMIDTFEPANDDSTLWRPIRKKVYEKQYFIHVIDTAKTPTGKRLVDTFYQVDPAYVLKDLNKKW